MEQEGFWLLERLVPGTPFSNLATAVRFTGSLSVQGLQDALDAAARRHETLRTSVVERGGDPAQVISPPDAVALATEDLTQLPEEQLWETFMTRAIREFRRPFDLAEGRLLRAALFKLAQDEHVLLLTVHHIVSDTWSLRLLHADVAAAYAASVAGDDATLPELGIQYGDYAAWQRDLLERGQLDGQLEYWLRQLDRGHLPLLQLPSDFPRPSALSFRTSVRTITLTGELANALRVVGQEEGGTLFMVLLTGFAALLHRFTGAHEIRVGTVIANRSRPELEQLVGPLINTLLLRIDLAGDPSLRVALKRVREVAIDAYANQDLPFECLVRALERDHAIERQTLFPVLFLFESGAPTQADLPNVTAEAIDVKALVETEVTVTSFDLIFTIREQAAAWSATLTYKTALFSEETIALLLGAFEHILTELAVRPARRLSGLPSVR